MLVPRRMIDNEESDYNDYMGIESVFILVDKMINRRNNKIKFMGYFDVRNVEFIELDYFKVLKTNNKVEVYDKTAEIQFDEYAFSNDYGKVSILILLGSLFVTLGVIITIVNILGGI